MKRAKSELSIAQKIIDLEKDYEKAKTHAEQALYLANRARFITELIIGFKKENLTQEQMILWYQDQLEQIHEGLDSSLTFDQPNRQVVASMNEAIRTKIMGANTLVNQQAKKLSQQKDYLKQLATETETLEELSQNFNEDEAEVLKRDNDIIIRSYGFQFDLGKSEILPRHYALLNKIVNTLKKFPKASIVVEEHTDASGSKARNMELSHQRAENIRAFLIKVAEIDESRIQSAGYGRDKPLASNLDEKGQAKNRRIEIVIKQ